MDKGTVNKGKSDEIKKKYVNKVKKGDNSMQQAPVEILLNGH